MTSRSIARLMCSVRLARRPVCVFASPLLVRREGGREGRGGRRVEGKDGGGEGRSEGGRERGMEER